MAQQFTTQFWPIFPRKSDGHEAVLQKGLMVKNGPNAQQLDRTPNAQGQCDYYRLLDRNEPKHLDWRKKLGGMLLRELGGRQNEDKWQQCLLWDFPEGYRLYEHIKSKADGQTKPVKTHSGGGHDRQDAYLYGHPSGPRKRFRSPVEFFPHLLWLSTDETSDSENCTCKICSPVQLEPEKPAAPSVTTTIPPVKKEHSPAVVPPASVPGSRNPVVQIPARRPSVPTSSTQSPAKEPTTPNTTRSTGPTPTPLPQHRSIDQQIDSQYGKFLARIGEIVWFHRDAGAWGLGVVIRRWIPKDGTSNRAYLVQPLSYPFESPRSQVILEDAKLKPWLAWSAPSCTYSFLQQNPLLTYDQVDWRSLLSGRYGSGNAEVDASILAAKATDTTYTLCERLKTVTNAGQEERYWNSMYLGAEKIWNGDPVRLHLGSGNDIMVVTAIVERDAPNTPQTGSAAPDSHSTIQFIGDFYTYATIPAPDANAPPEPPANPYLPIRMREDMRWRNRVLVSTTHLLAYWKLVASQARLDISEVKGRWYETSIVFADSFHAAVKKNEGGNGIWMNARGDCTSAGKVAGVRKLQRTDALGAAVPKETILIEGFDVPNQEEQSKPPTNEMQSLELSVGGNDSSFALDDFMNLDGMEGGEMAFEDHFTF